MQTVACTRFFARRLPGQRLCLSVSVRRVRGQEEVIRAAPLRAVGGAARRDAGCLHPVGVHSESDSHSRRDL